MDGEVWWLGRQEDRGAARRRVEDLEVRLARAAPSATHVHSHLFHLRRPPPLTLDTLQWCSSLRLNPNAIVPEEFAKRTNDRGIQVFSAKNCRILVASKAAN